MAPGATLISVKAADDTGRSSSADVLTAIQWVIDHQQQYNIRVMNLSLNSPVQDSYLVDPLDAAVELAWLHGITVVVAAGNCGVGAAGVMAPGSPPPTCPEVPTGQAATFAPANDPFVIAVGGTNDRGTAGHFVDRFPTRQDLLEVVFLDETNELRVRAEELASAPVPLDAFITWLRLQMDFAARGRSMGAAVMAAKHVPGTRIYAANIAMLQAGGVLLLRSQDAGQIRGDVLLLDVVRLVYGMVMVNEHASDPDGINRMLDLVIAGIRTKLSRD